MPPVCDVHLTLIMADRKLPVGAELKPEGVSFRVWAPAASRFQREGPHGPSEVVDPRAFHWTDEGWGGVSIAGQVIYEMHVGTFTGEGTWAGAADELAELARLGITAIELMPVAEFAGRFG